MARAWMLLAGMVLLACALGAGPCRYQAPTAFPPSPVVFPRAPTLAEISQFRAMTAGKVRQLQASGATLTVRGMPSLRADIALEQPKRFRLRAGTMVTGQELDIGSNDELFWLWVARNQPPVVYFCRHEQYAASAARQVIPIEPSWLAESLGLVTFDSQYQHQGPFAAGPQRIEIRTLVPSPGGNLVKSTILHEQYGYVLEQRVHDAQQRLIAQAIASRHQFDAATGVSLPRTIEIELPTMPLAFTLDVAEYSVNRLNDDPAQLWGMPKFEGYQPIDLADPRLPRLPRPSGLAPGPVTNLNPAPAPPLAATTPFAAPPGPAVAPIAPPVASPVGSAPATNPGNPPAPQPWAPSNSGGLYPQAERPAYRGMTREKY